jgi:hypothetical protein
MNFYKYIYAIHHVVCWCGSINKHKKSLKIPKGGNQNLYIKEEQTTQWPKDKVQKDKQQFYIFVNCLLIFLIRK